MGAVPRGGALIGVSAAEMVCFMVVVCAACGSTPTKRREYMEMEACVITMIHFLQLTASPF